MSSSSSSSPDTANEALKNKEEETKQDDDEEEEILATTMMTKTTVSCIVEADGVTTVECWRPTMEDLKDMNTGPLRFAPVSERSISEQIASLTTEERKCFDILKSRWMEQNPEHPFSDEMYLRFARCSPGRYKFNDVVSWAVMKRFDRRYLTLSATSLQSQLLTKTLFPIPGVQTKEGHDMFYMRPSRYFPKQTSTKQIIDNLVYCMTTMIEKEKACTEGIGFLAYMNDWKMKNFSIDYCLQFMKTLQGRVPCRVRLFLIVNPPGWFGKIWAIMKPMLNRDFREKVHMILESQLQDFLSPTNYQDYLPDDMTTGKAPTDELVTDFITYRQFVEEHNNNNSNQYT